MAHMAHTSVATIHSALALTTRPSCPQKYRLWRQPYRTADVLETNATSYMDIVEGKTQTHGAYGAYVCGYDSQRSGRNHSAILLSKYRL